MIWILTYPVSSRRWKIS
ncbi:UNVERIFIED_CONTAM: hypothetical protein GTU68_048312 [Idotea baltica]|nr:hypothetical protein [Idotea baltica]